MNNVIYLTGIPSPKTRLQQRVQDLDPDLFPRMLANHPAHIARSRAKAERIKAEIEARAKAEKEEKAAAERFTQFLGGLSVASMLGLILVVALAL